MDCDERFNSVHQVAVLQYDGASSTDYPNENDVDYQHSHKEGLVSVKQRDFFRFILKQLLERIFQSYHPLL